MRSDIRNYVTEQVPWKVTKTFILDRAVGGRGAHITVDPPPFVSAGCGQQRTKRRPNDRKRLTALGEQALARPQRVRVKGQLWCGSTVWRLIYECKGTVLCDGRCSMRVALSATVAQVHSELVQFDVYRCGAVVTSAQGLHRAGTPAPSSGIQPPSRDTKSSYSQLCTQWPPMPARRFWL